MLQTQLERQRRLNLKDSSKRLLKLRLAVRFHLLIVNLRRIAVIWSDEIGKSLMQKF